MHTSGPRIRISPSSASLRSIPGTGLPTVPVRKSVGVLVVAVPVSSVMPQTSMTSMPRPARYSSTSTGIGAAPLPAHSAFSRPSIVRIGSSTAASSAAAWRPVGRHGLVGRPELEDLERDGAGGFEAGADPGSAAASRAWTPATIFSQIRGTPKKPIGRAWLERREQLGGVGADG